MAHLECELLQHCKAGDNTIFIAEVERGAMREGRPLLYYRGQFAQLASWGELPPGARYGMFGKLLAWLTRHAVSNTLHDAVKLDHGHLVVIVSDREHVHEPEAQVAIGNK